MELTPEQQARIAENRRVAVLRKERVQRAKMVAEVKASQDLLEPLLDKAVTEADRFGRDLARCEAEVARGHRMLSVRKQRSDGPLLGEQNCAEWRRGIIADYESQKSFVCRLSAELEVLRARDFKEHDEPLRQALVAANAEKVRLKTLVLEKETVRLAEKEPRAAAKRAEEDHHLASVKEAERFLQQAEQKRSAAFLIFEASDSKRQELASHMNALKKSLASLEGGGVPRGHDLQGEQDAAEIEAKADEKEEAWEDDAAVDDGDEDQATVEAVDDVQEHVDSEKHAGGVLEDREKEGDVKPAEMDEEEVRGGDEAGAGKVVKRRRLSSVLAPLLGSR